MIRIERDPAFWAGVCAHPAVSEGLFGIAPETVASFAVGSGVIPIAAEHGGFLFAKQDALGCVFELHSLFTPDGWGREVVRTGQMAFGFLFDRTRCQLLTTLESMGNPRSRPPRRAGFVPAGDATECELGSFRLWLLTRAAWQATPYAAQRTLH